MPVKFPTSNSRFSGLIGSKSTKGAATTPSSGKDTKGAAASTSSEPAKNAKNATSTSQGVGHQDELQQRFQALKDSMPRPAKHAGTTATPNQGEGYLSKLQQNQYERNKAKAQGGDNQPAPAGNELVPVKAYYDGGKPSASSWRMPYDGPELLNGTYMKPTPSWSKPYDGPELLNGTHMKPTPSGSKPSDGPASSPGAHTPPSRSNSMEPETHSMALTTTTPPSKTHSTAGGEEVGEKSAKEKWEATIKKAAFGTAAIGAIGLTAWAASEMSKGDSSASNQQT